MLITAKTSRIHKLTKTCTTFSNQTLFNSHYQKNASLVQLFPKVEVLYTEIKKESLSFMWEEERKKLLSILSMHLIPIYYILGYKGLYRGYKIVWFNVNVIWMLENSELRVFVIAFLQITIWDSENHLRMFQWHFTIRKSVFTYTHEKHIFSG